MYILIGIVVVIIILVAVSSLFKKSNQDINDYYPFDPRNPKL